MHLSEKNNNKSSIKTMIEQLNFYLKTLPIPWASLVLSRLIFPAWFVAAFKGQCAMRNLDLQDQFSLIKMYQNRV